MILLSAAVEHKGTNIPLTGNEMADLFMSVKKKGLVSAEY